MSDDDSDSLDRDSYEEGGSYEVKSLLAVYKGEKTLVLVEWEGGKNDGDPWEPSWIGSNDLQTPDLKKAFFKFKIEQTQLVYTPQKPPPLNMRALVGYPEYQNHRGEWMKSKSDQRERAAKETVQKRSRIAPEDAEFIDEDDAPLVLDDAEEDENCALIETKGFDAANGADIVEAALSHSASTAVEKEKQALQIFSESLAVTQNKNQEILDAATVQMCKALKDGQYLFDAQELKCVFVGPDLYAVCHCNSKSKILKGPVVATVVEELKLDLKTFKRHIGSQKCFDSEGNKKVLSQQVQQQQNQRHGGNALAIDMADAISIVRFSFGPYLFQQNSLRFKSPRYRVAFVSLALRLVELIYDEPSLAMQVRRHPLAPGFDMLVFMPLSNLNAWTKLLSSFIKKINTLSRFRRLKIGPVDQMVTSSTSSSYLIIAYEFMASLCTFVDKIPEVELLLLQWQRSNRQMSGAQKRQEGFLRATYAELERLQNLSLYVAIWERLVIYAEFAGKLLRITAVNGTDFLYNLICEYPFLEYSLQVAAVLGIFVIGQGNRPQILTDMVFISEEYVEESISSVPVMKTDLLQQLSRLFVSGVAFKDERCYLLICEDKIGKLSYPSGLQMMYYTTFCLKLLQVIATARWKNNIPISSNVPEFLKGILLPVFVRKNMRKHNVLTVIQNGSEFLTMIEHGLSTDPPEYFPDNNRGWTEGRDLPEDFVKIYSALENFRLLRRVSVNVSSVLFHGDYSLLEAHALVTRHSILTVEQHYHSTLRFESTVKAGFNVAKACFGVDETHYPRLIVSQQQSNLEKQLTAPKMPPSPVDILALQILCRGKQAENSLSQFQYFKRVQLEHLVSNFAELVLSEQEITVLIPSVLGGLESFLFVEAKLSGLLACSCCSQPLFKKSIDIECNKYDALSFAFNFGVGFGNKVFFKCKTENSANFLRQRKDNKIDIIGCSNVSAHSDLCEKQNCNCICEGQWALTTSKKMTGTFESIEEFNKQVLLV